MDLELAGRRYLIAGASSGLGAAVARTLITEGSSVVAVARREMSGAIAKDLGVPANRHLTLQADLSTASGSRLLRDLLTRGPELDGIIICIGDGTPVQGSLTERFESSFDRNIKPILLTLDAALDFLKNSEQSSVVLVSSIAGVEWLPCPPEYAASKAALRALSAHLAREYAPRRFNVLAPGNILTDGSVWERRLEQDADGLKEFLAQQVPLARLADPAEVALLAVYLLSPSSRFITGATLVADGGQTHTW